MVIPVEFQVVEYVLGDEVEVISEPTLVPSTKNCTPAIPMSSVEVAVRVTDDPETVEPAVGTVRKTVGGVVSGVTAKL